ncbi:MAG: radical SAM protein [Bacteroidales bacterium]|nr:radical SAM protein [Bacteroidales bacterium]
MRILLLTPPLTQLNTPYPATAALKGYLVAHGQTVSQADLGIELVDMVLSPNFLQGIGLEEAAAVIEPVKRFLRGQDDTLAPRIANRTLLPEGPRFEQVDDLEWAFGIAGTYDKALHLATLFVEDIADYIRTHVDAHFDLVRYAEHLSSYAPSFDPLVEELSLPPSHVDEVMLQLLQRHVAAFKPDLVGITIPFPGCLYAALRCAQWLKQHTQAPVALGGGFVNTEWRQLSDARLFDYVDYVTFDDGELPTLRIAQHGELVRTLTRDTLVPDFIHISHFQHIDDADASLEQCPDYSDLPFHLYLNMAEMTNPMHRLWSQGRWNKMMMAHGCYWARCAFCDTSLDYIGRYKVPAATTVVDRMERIAAQTGSSGFHFVDEALPPKLLGEVADEIVRRKLTFTFWGNIRFERTYNAELCDRLAQAGCIAVSGGLEVASDRLLKLMNKGVTIAQTVDACRHLRDAGIMVHTYLMYGFPTETLQESVDALETVRSMFDEGIVQSAFWHRYAMTCHSPSGLHPEAYGVQRTTLEPNPFCNNEVDFSPDFDYDIEAVGAALRLATYNYMNGLGLDQPVRSWFPIRVPKPSQQKK